MYEQCARLGIAIPENANKRQLEAALEVYFKDAVVVHTDNGVDLRQTDNPTAEYTIHFSITGMHTIRSESEDAACEWMRKNADECFIPSFGNIEDIYDYDIHGVYKSVVTITTLD